jgi:hypothetical protein
MTEASASLRGLAIERDLTTPVAGLALHFRIVVANQESIAATDGTGTRRRCGVSDVQIRRCTLRLHGRSSPGVMSLHQTSDQKAASRWVVSQEPFPVVLGVA